MRSLKFSPFGLIWLANSNELSLPLCYQWQKRTGWNPVTAARGQIHFPLTVVSLYLTGWLLFDYIKPDPVQTIETGHILLSLPCIIYSFFVLVFFAGFGEKDVRGFGVALRQFLEWSEKNPKDIVLCDLPGLRAIAKHILIDVAERVLEQQDLGDSTGVAHSRWAFDMGALQADFEERYKVLASLGLASGGYHYFYKEGRKNRAAKKSEKEAAT